MPKAGRTQLAFRLTALAAGVMAVAAPISPARTTHIATAARNATLRTFAGTWYAHTSGLKITRQGIARESIGDGCCDPIIDLSLRLSQPRGTSSDATVLARVTAVQVHNSQAFTAKHPAPRVGEARRLRLKNGVITEPLTNSVYCNMTADLRGTCGA
jgi:hypothetical protein